MDIISFTLGIITGAGLIGAGAIIGYDSHLQRQRKELTRKAQEVPVPQEPPQRPQEKKPPQQLGAVKRPEAEDLEKINNPRIKEEEDAWGESLGVFPGVAKMFESPYRGLWTY